jgi:DNA-binding transcriptional MocR family regulator
MTPAEQEVTLIALWNAGTEITAIAQRLGIPKGTVQSRAHRLQQRGLIQPRPKGGAYPRQKSLARQDGSPAPPATPQHPRHPWHPRPPRSLSWPSPKSRNC